MLFMCRTLLLLVVFCFFPVKNFAKEAPIVVSITPLKWLVETISPPGTDVKTLLPNGKSPHDYQLRPADISTIKTSALLVWAGPGLEPWLMQISSDMPATRQLALLQASSSAQRDNDKNTLQNTLAEDPHLWLDPLRFAAVAAPLAARLTQLYPKDKTAIAQRLADFQRTMTALDATLAEGFAPVAKRGFVVYHDAYGALVARYGLNQQAAVWRHESVAGGAGERAVLTKLLQSGDVACMFYEPEYGADAVAGWLGKAARHVRMVELDPLGQDIPLGPNSYLRFVRALTDKMQGCLQQKQ